MALPHVGGVLLIGTICRLHEAGRGFGDDELITE